MFIDIFFYFYSQFVSPPIAPEIIMPMGKWVVVLGICICNRVFEPTSTRVVFPIFISVPPLFLCHLASGDKILLYLI